MNIFDEDTPAVCPPCGHAICKGCLNSYIDIQDDPTAIPCPCCKAEFALVKLDEEWIPDRLRNYLYPPIRKIFFPAAHVSAQETIQELEDKVRDLQTSLSQINTRTQSYQAEVRRLSNIIAEKDNETAILANMVDQRDRALAHSENQVRDLTSRIENMESWNTSESMSSNSAVTTPTTISPQRYQTPQSAAPMASLASPTDTSSQYFPSNHYAQAMAASGYGPPRTVSQSPAAYPGGYTLSNASQNANMTYQWPMGSGIMWGTRNNAPGPSNTNQSPGNENGR